MANKSMEIMVVIAGLCADFAIADALERPENRQAKMACLAFEIERQAILLAAEFDPEATKQ